jgi:ketosteroid isomerase-like protein
VPEGDFDARDFIERYFAVMWDLSQQGIEALREWEADDIVWELPWSESFPEFRGLEQHHQVLSGMTSRLAGYEIRATDVYETPDPNEVIVIAQGGGPTRDGRDYRNEHIMFMRFRDGKVAHVREFFNVLKTRELVEGAPRADS